MVWEFPRSLSPPRTARRALALIKYKTQYVCMYYFYIDIFVFIDG